MDAATTARLCEALEPVAPGASAFKRMRERILYSISDTPIQAVRPNDRQWQILLPGVAVKILRADMIERTQTALWKLDAGARIPAHAHVLEEECMILQGEQGERDYCPPLSREPESFAADRFPRR